MKSIEKVALITGGAQGIGKGIAKSFLDNHVKVIIVDSDKEAGNETVKEFSSLGEISFYPADISNESQIKKLMNFAKKTYGRLDFLINNAGIMIRKPIQKLSLTEWNKVININLTSAFLCTKYAAPLLKKTKGSIVNMASTRAFMSEANTESYSASKGGIVALTHALSISLGPDIRVNSISPGWIEVSEWKKSRLRHKAKHTATDLSQHPVNLVGEPQDIAAMVLFLTSANAKFITGCDFTIDGGMTHKMIYV